tara:strand:+ start:2105 stop:3196 length:1092 start_codon:yes stop_codon:yes gene_type:complete
MRYILFLAHTMPAKSKRLYTLHPNSLSVEYGNIENVTAHQAEAILGTPGSVIEQTNKDGVRYYTHQFYDGDGKKRQQYISGPIGSDDADATADAMRTKIEEVNDLVKTLRMLGREGFILADVKTYATIGALHNHGVFEAGGMLIGSHAYGVLLNKLGVRAALHKTDDIDIARREKLAFEKLPNKNMLEMLRESGVDFVEVPSLKRGAPATSFKKKGRAQFHVDLLVPSRDETFPTVAVPELGAHATALPYLKYLLAESQPATLLARQGCCEVRVPLPERYAVHKLVVSQLRTGRGAKSTKDVDQASVLCAALAELHPGAVEEAVEALPRKMVKHFRKALPAAQKCLEDVAPQAWAELCGDKAP